MEQGKKVKTKLGDVIGFQVKSESGEGAFFSLNATGSDAARSKRVLRVAFPEHHEKLSEAAEELRKELEKAQASTADMKADIEFAEKDLVATLRQLT
jgi:hypothetical protein